MKLGVQYVEGVYHIALFNLTFICGVRLKINLIVLTGKCKFT